MYVLPNSSELVVSRLPDTLVDNSCQPPEVFSHVSLSAVSKVAYCYTHVKEERAITVQYYMVYINLVRFNLMQQREKERECMSEIKTVKEREKEKVCER